MDPSVAELSAGLTAGRGRIVVIVRRLRIPHPDGSYQWQFQITRLTADPTATAPQFQLIEVGHTTDDATLGTWVSGAWADPPGYNAATDTAWAASPIIGTGGLAIEAGRSYRLMCRLDLGNGLTPILEPAHIEVAGSLDQPVF